MFKIFSDDRDRNRDWFHRSICIMNLIEDTHGLPPGMGASEAGPIGGRRGSYANAALAEYPARPYAS